MPETIGFKSKVLKVEPAPFRSVRFCRRTMTVSRRRCCTRAVFATLIRPLRPRGFEDRVYRDPMEFEFVSVGRPRPAPAPPSTCRRMDRGVVPRRRVCGFMHWARHPTHI